MMTSVSLKEIERRAYRSTFEDGLYDLGFGFVFLILGWLPVLELTEIPRYYGYLLFLIPAALIPIGKRCITVPRLGSVAFGPERKHRRKLVMVAVGVVLILMLPLVLMLLAQGGFGGRGWMTLAIIAAPLVGLAMVAVDFPRFYLYVALLLAAVVQTEFLLPLLGSPLNGILSFGLPGIAIFLFGGSLLVRFISVHPVQTAEYDREQE